MARQVGARHGIMMKNAMVHYTMFEPYLEWCSYVKHEVEDSNDLHMRVLTKLQTMELKGIIRARAIFYVKIHHLLLCALKSNARAATQSDMCKFLTELKQSCAQMKDDAEYMMDPDDGPGWRQAICRRHCCLFIVFTIVGATGRRIACSSQIYFARIPKPEQ